MKVFNKNRIIYLLPIFLILSLSACGKKPTIPTYDDEIDPVDEIEMFGMVSGIDEVNGKISIRSIGYTTDKEFSFTGSADIQDKFGNYIAMESVPLGAIVNLTYDGNRDKLMSLHLTKDETVEKLEGISGARIDYLENTITIGSKTYQMSKNTSVFSDNKEIGLDEICSEDQLSVWLYNNMVCSIYVELGHGYVKLTDYASYMGGMVEIGYDVIVPVTEDMLLTVREGTYTLRISKGKDTGSKQVTVEKNKEQTISLADLVVEPKQVGSILFKITPSDAAVYIDKVRINTEGAVDIVYGKHRIDIVKDGYDTISGTISVKEAYKIKEFTMKKTDEDNSDKSSSKNDKTTTSSTSSSSTTETSTETTTENSTEKDVNTETGTKTKQKVTVKTPDGASVYFDGEYIGIAPISFTKVTGSHIITLSKTGCLSKSYTVTFTDDGQDKELTYDELVTISSLIE